MRSTVPALSPRERALFTQALEQPSSEACKAFLDGACGNDVGLRQRLDALLDRFHRLGTFLENPVISVPEQVHQPGGAGAETSSPTLAVPVTEKPGDRIGRYKLLQEIGEGGCGVVYMAEQEEPVRRRVALKVIKLGMDTKQVIARFEAERQALALMDHPNIAKVLDAGATETGRPYFVMELVRGIKITDYCDQKNLSNRQRLDLFIQVCHAIQHAHQKGIIHRDIKPSNVLVSLHDGTPVPVVIDFGIAKATAQQRLTDKTLFTAFEQFIGTPAYMSPEQAELSRWDIDTRSDVYSLGVLLYELLTGKTPFDPETLLSAGLDEVRRILREQEPVRPSTRLTQELVDAGGSPHKSTKGLAIPTQAEVSADSRRRLRLKEQIHLVRGDLDWIVMKCLEKDRARRYETANGLARDLERHLNHEPVVARPPSTAYRLQKFVRRNKAAVTAGAAVTAALVLGVLISTWQAVRATKAEREAVAAREKERELRQLADAKTEENRRRLVELNAANAARLLREDQSFAALPSLIEGLRLEQGRAEAEELQRQRLGIVLHECPKPVHIWFHDESVNCAAFSPDGRRVATGTGRAVLYSADKGTPGQVQVWDAGTGQPIGRPVAHSSSIREIQFSPDGHRVAAATADGTALLIHADTGEPVFSEAFQHGNSVVELAFNRDGTLLATASPDFTARVWDTQNGRCLAVLQHGFQVNGLDFSPDGDRLITTAAFIEGLLCVWNARTGANLTNYPNLHGGHIMDVRWSPDGGKWATASIDGTAKVWDAQSGKELATLHVGEAADTVEFSRDGRRVLTLSSGSAARIWDAQNGAMLAPPIRHDGLVRAEFSPDGLAVATASRDRTARAWDAKTGQPLTPSLAHQDEVLQASFSPAGHCLLTVSSDHTVRLWELAVGGPSFELGSQLPVTGLALSPDQHRVLTASRDGLLGRAQLWDLRTGAAIGSPIQHLRALSEVAFSADGRRVLTASFDTTARVWETDTGQAVTPPLTHQEGVAHAAFSPDGQRVATGSLDKTAMVWEVPAGRPITPPLRHDREVQWVAFSPDGQRLVTGCRDRRAYVWDVATGTELLRLNAHRDWVLQSVFSPDGRQILTASTDGTARLWDAATGMALSALRHLGIVKTASFSADGKRVVTASYDRTARIWEADTGRAVTPPLNHEGWVEQAAFSDDGRWVVTACADGTARLWSASDGGPVASAIRLGASVRDVFLSKDGQALVAGGGCVAAVWHWAKAEQSLADLESMARLLTGQETDPQGRVVMVRGEDLKQLWQTFRAKPAQPAPLAVPSWHQRALAQALDRRDTYAVRFHLNPLLERTPGDVRLLGLRARLASSEAGSLEGEWTLTEPFAESRSHVPPRAAGTPVNLIDLSDYYNRPLTESGAWEGPMELYNLSSLPRGIQTLARVKFDLRGWVILAGTRDASLYLPKRVSGIKVGGRCRRIHFLHATAYPADPEKKIATYMIHYADGACAERPMIYGRDVQNFKWQNESELKEQPEAVCAWTGTNYLTAEMGYRYRLYKSVWENPRPDVAVERIDLESSLAGSGPFLIAISAE